MENKNHHSFVVERYAGSVENSGHSVTVFRDERYESPDEIVFLKGGLGDCRSSSLGNIAKKIVRESEGRIATGIVRTIRPRHLHHAVAGSVRARKSRSDSLSGAIVGGIEKYNPRKIIVAGQSEGGITSVDAVNGLLADSELRSLITERSVGVHTIDTPGVYSPVEGQIVNGLGRLAANCLPDVVGLGWRERFRLIRDASKRGVSIFEPLYLIGEVSYLRTIDIRDDIQELKNEQIAVSHAFHRGDIVPDRELATEADFIDDGGHIAVIHGMGATRMAMHIVGLVEALPQPPPLLKAS